MLDYPPNPRPGALYLVRFTCPEFTSLCPVTGAPDFAHIVIDYVPGETIVESKALKLFLGAFRNHAGFHEDVTVGIGQSSWGPGRVFGWRPSLRSRAFLPCPPVQELLPGLVVRSGASQGQSAHQVSLPKR